MSTRKNNMTLRMMVGMLVLLLCTSFGVVPEKNHVQAATIKISASSISLKVGKTKNLKLKNTSKKAVWTSKNTKVATVGKSTGKVKAVGAGTTTVTATLNGKKYTCTVKVTAPTPQEKLDAVLAAVKKAYGENYRPNMSMTQLDIKDKTGLDTSSYDAMIGQMPMMSTQVDTIIGLHAKSGKKAQVEAAVKKYQSYLINDSLQYPFNISKVNASTVVTVDDYVFFIMLGKTNDDETNETKLVNYYKDQNQIAVNAIKKALGK